MDVHSEVGVVVVVGVIFSPKNQRVFFHCALTYGAMNFVGRRMHGDRWSIESKQWGMFLP
jgi:hypothetical protein